MSGVTELELAEGAGTTVESIRRMIGAGVLDARPDGTFGPADVQRVRVLEACERSGLSIEDIGRAMAGGHLSLSFLDLVFSEPILATDKTYADMCRELGWDFEFVELTHEAVGLPRPLPDQRVREDDLRMFPAAQFVLATGLEEANVGRVLRVYAENMARIAQAEAQFYHSYIEEPMLAAGLPEMQMLSMAAQISPQLSSMAEGLIVWLYRRHQEYSIIEHVIEHVETAMEEAGLSRARAVDPPAMMFLDLVGYTRLTEERGDDAAAELAASLAQLVQRESRRHGGRPVKWLGDGVMFHFPVPGDAVRCALTLVEEAPRSGMPPAHVGVNAGPVVFRDGDYFGRTVNIAARIASQAGASEVMVSRDVVELGLGDGVAFEEIGPRDLKGLSSPVTLYRARRA